MKAAPPSKEPLLARAGEVELEFRPDGRAVAVQPYRLTASCLAHLAPERFPLATNLEAAVIPKGPVKIELPKNTPMRLSERGLSIAVALEAEILAEGVHFSATGERIRFLGTVPVLVEAGTLICSIEKKASQDFAREAA